MRQLGKGEGLASHCIDTAGFYFFPNLVLISLPLSLLRPYEFPTVFSFFLPEYVPDSGPNLVAKLSSPESMIVTMPNVVNLLNGMYSLIKYGLGDCNSGFSRYPGYSDCSDNGLYERSFGHLFYEPTGVDDYERAADLALLLTAGRLSDANLNTIVNACSTEPDQPSKTRCMQQLIVSTGEFHSTNSVTQSGEARAAETAVADSTESYKVSIYLGLCQCGVLNNG